MVVILYVYSGGCTTSVLPNSFIYNPFKLVICILESEEYQYDNYEIKFTKQHHVCFNDMRCLLLHHHKFINDSGNLWSFSNCILSYTNHL